MSRSTFNRGGSLRDQRIYDNCIFDEIDKKDAAEKARKPNPNSKSERAKIPGTPEWMAIHSMSARAIQGRLRKTGYANYKTSRL